jgi:hypothetical protein
MPASPLTRGGGTGLSAAIFFALASHRKKGFPLQSLARKTDILLSFLLDNCLSASGVSRKFPPKKQSSSIRIKSR